MNQLGILSAQTKDAYHWTNKLISSIPYNTWDTLPEVIESSVSWQVGHLVMSFYFHSVVTIAGHSSDISKMVPLRQYAQFFSDAPPKGASGKVNPEELHRHLIWMEDTSVKTIQSLSSEDLESALEPTSVPHPIAKTKGEALDWNIKHTMWHYGRLAILKRVVDHRFDFGLKKAK